VCFIFGVIDYYNFVDVVSKDVINCDWEVPVMREWHSDRCIVVTVHWQVHTEQ